MSQPNAPYVTEGDTPSCESCRSYYSERHCEDCGLYLCTWCNLRLHEPIGARNHHRPRLYGTDPYAHLEAPPQSTADRILAEHARAASGGAGGSESGRSGGGVGKHTFDATTGRVNVTTEHVLPVGAEDAWDVCGDFDAPFVPNGVEANDSMDRRVVRLRVPRVRPAAVAGGEDEEEEEEEEEIDVTEKLLQRDERDMTYSYSRSVPPAAALPYTEFLSKFSFVPLPPAANGSKQCVLQWTASVAPREGVEPREAAEAVQREHSAWLPYMDAAIQMEE